MNKINSQNKVKHNLDFRINNTISQKEITSLQIILDLRKLFKYNTNILSFSNTNINTNYFTKIKTTPQLFKYNINYLIKQKVN